MEHMQQPQKQIRHYPGLGRWGLVAGIVIVLNMFFNYTLSLVYPAPQFDAFMPQSQVTRSYDNQKDCVAAGGQWTAQPDQKLKGMCDPEYTARAKYDAAQKQYDRTIFIILVILGAVTLVGGMFVSNLVLSPALSWGGVLSLVIASMRYWSSAGGAIKVLLLGAALAGLVWVAVRKFSIE